MGNWSSTEPEWVPQNYNSQTSRNFYEEEDGEWSPFSSKPEWSPFSSKPIYLQTENKIGMSSYPEDCLRDRKLLGRPQNQVRENWYITEPKRVLRTYYVGEERRFPVPIKLENTRNFNEEDDEARRRRSRFEKTLEQMDLAIDNLRLQREKKNKLESYTDYRDQKLYLNQQVRDNQSYKPRCQENLVLSNPDSLAGLSSQFKNLSIADKKRLPTPKLIKFNPAIIKDFLRNNGYAHWCGKVDNYSPYILDTLENDSLDFSNIKRLFKRKNHSYFQVTHIEKLYNPYLLMQYKLKGKQYGERFGSANEKVLFHGTKSTNKVDICNFNLDWRLYGRHKFGKGVSFASVSNYATHYGDKSRRKIMFVVDVYVNKQCLGNPDTIIPPMMYDTTTNATKQVLVKYEDNVFYPSYVVHYEQFKATRKPNNH